jgi:hypothetical protein
VLLREELHAGRPTIVVNLDPAETAGLGRMTVEVLVSIYTGYPG